MLVTVKSILKKVIYITSGLLVSSPVWAADSFWQDEKIRQALMNFGADAIVALSPFLLGILTILLTRAIQFLSTKTKNEKVKGALNKTDDALLRAIQYTNAVYSQKIKEARAENSPGGTSLTPEESKEAMEKTLEAFRNYMGQQGLKDIYSVLGLTPDTAEEALKIRAEALLNQENINKKALFSRVSTENEDGI